MDMSRIRDRGDSGRIRAFLDVGERWRVATKTKLERAVEERASELPDAQREIVLAQFAVYKANRLRIAEIDDALKLSGRDPGDARSRLCTERSQLTMTNTEIMSKLFDQLDG